MTVKQMADIQGFSGIIHFVGIGGIGMSGIAEILVNLGCRVQGSDIAESSAVQRLRDMGCEIFVGHSTTNVVNADVLVVSSAITPDNLEVQAARQRRIPVLQRAEMLAELMRSRFGIAVAGTHGKTTTTSLIATLLSTAQLDPTYVVGGKVESFNNTAGLGTSQYLVVEADESDTSFLHLKPIIAIVTNIDKDHMASYDNDFAKLKAGFSEFISNIPFYGLAIVYGDDPVLCELREEVPRHFLTYGFGEHCDIRVLKTLYDGPQSCFEVALPWRDQTVEMHLNMPGEHNVLNALAAIGIAHEFGIEDELIQNALNVFAGIRRRFQIHGEIMMSRGRVLLVDDYAHHPTAIKAAYDACCTAWPERRKVLVFQPHRYTRLHDLFDEFSVVLSRVDQLLLTDVYAAGEDPIAGVDSRTLTDAVHSHGGKASYIQDLDGIVSTLDDILREGDLLITMGAGSISTLSKKLIAERECCNAA